MEFSIEELKQDIYNLYVKTSNKNIEKCLIVLSQDIDSQIVEWLCQKSNLTALIDNGFDPNFAKALFSLAHAKQTGVANVPALFLMKDKNKNVDMGVNFDIYLGFYKMYESGVFLDILKPFESMLIPLQRVVPKNPDETLTEIRNDAEMQKINDFVVSNLGSKFIAPTRKLNLKEKKNAAFFNLLQRISNDFSNAALEMGDQQLADDFSSKKIIMLAPELMKRFPYLIVTETAKRHVKEIMVRLKKYKFYEDIDFTHALILNTSLLFANEISKDDFNRFLDKRVSGVDFSKYTPSSFRVDDKIDYSLKYDKSSLINPFSIVLSHLVLKEIFNEVK